MSYRAHSTTLLFFRHSQRDVRQREFPTVLKLYSTECLEKNRYFFCFSQTLRLPFEGNYGHQRYRSILLAARLAAAHTAGALPAWIAELAGRAEAGRWSAPHRTRCFAAVASQLLESARRRRRHHASRLCFLLREPPR